MDDGFEIVRAVFTADEVAEIAGHLPHLDGAAGSRNLLAIPFFARLALCDRLFGIVAPVLGDRARPVRAILFDKSAEVNWALGWHQDTKIAVAARHDVAGFAGWSVKEGVVHCRPPVEILAGMLAARIAIDRNDVTNGPLRILPGTHRDGYLSRAQVEARAAAATVDCLTEPGDLVWMRPMVLHASGRVTSPLRRRVVHIEYASGPLPNPLEWAHADASRVPASS